MATKTTIHLVSGEHVEAEGTPEEVMVYLVGNGLVQLGEVIVNPAHVTHLQIAPSKEVSFG